MLRGVENQSRVEDGEAERREDLNEEQHCRSLRSVGETAFEKVHPALLCRSTRRVMSSRGSDVSSAVARWIGLSELDGLNNRQCADNLAASRICYCQCVETTRS